LPEASAAESRPVGTFIRQAVGQHLGADGSDGRDACRDVLELAADHLIECYGSIELIQEFVFHRIRVTGDPSLAVVQGKALRALDQARTLR
jgi:hypothetical protein